MFNSILDACGDKRITRIRDLESRIGSCVDGIPQITEVLVLGGAGVTDTSQRPRSWGGYQENGKTC